MKVNVSKIDRLRNFINLSKRHHFYKKKLLNLIRANNFHKLVLSIQTNKLEIEVIFFSFEKMVPVQLTAGQA